MTAHLGQTVSVASATYRVAIVATTFGWVALASGNVAPVAWPVDTLLCAPIAALRPGQGGAARVDARDVVLWQERPKAWRYDR